MKIFKYELSLTGENKVSMPSFSRVLCVQEQRGAICLWAVVDEREENEVREFAVYGTGHPLPDPIGYHVGTVQIGDYVWHVFEITDYDYDGEY